MLNWLKKLFTKEKHETHVGETFTVNSPDDARAKFAEQIMRSGKPMQGTVDWDDEGKGTATITEVGDK